MCMFVAMVYSVTKWYKMSNMERENPSSNPDSSTHYLCKLEEIFPF